MDSPNVPIASTLGGGVIGSLQSLLGTVVIAVFVVYVGIAMMVVLRTDDVRKAEIRYRVFRDLLGLFRRRGRR